MTSQGQRFRRRALRRGYKVDEVDAFLDRVEATLAGKHVGAPVGAPDVRDVVFRVRFGGYDEWQVDLHLDRVERQLAELEDSGGRPHDPRVGPERMNPERVNPERMSPERSEPDWPGPDRNTPDRTGAPTGRFTPPTERLAAPTRDERPMPPPRGAPPTTAGSPVSPMPAPTNPDSFPHRDEPVRHREQPVGYDTGSYDAFEPGRHGRTDMTAEIRLPERDKHGYGTGSLGVPAPTSGPPIPSSPRSAPPLPGSSMGAPTSGTPFQGETSAPNPKAHRVDQLRRTFQARRFGSGYDPAQVDQLFEGILMAVSGRGPMPISETQLETFQFGLVPGGYFEPEVDVALREVKDMLRGG